MCNIYGIVKVEYNSYNKGEYFVSISHVIILILPKCAKTREPKDNIMYRGALKNNSIYMWHYTPRQP